MKIDDGIHAFEISEQEPVVRCFDEACRALGKDPVHSETFGGSDGNHYALHGIPTAVLSCGIYECHTTAEYTRVEDILDGATLVSLLIRAEETSKGL